MTHRQKVDFLLAEISKAPGVKLSMVAPPFFRLLWKLGCNVPPPLFLGFIQLTLITGIPFGILFGIFFLWFNDFLMLIPDVDSWLQTLVVALSSGLFFGLATAWYIRWKAARVHLSSWNSFPEGLVNVNWEAVKELEYWQWPGSWLLAFLVVLGLLLALLLP